MIYKPETSNISNFADIGSDTKIHSHCWIGAEVKIGNRCKIQAFAFIPNGVTIQDDVFIGPRVTFTNDKHPPSGGKRWTKTLVCSGAAIGAGVTMLSGIVIGKNAMIGAGSVVTKSVPDGETWIGNPARKLESKEKIGFFRKLLRLFPTRI